MMQQDTREGGVRIARAQVDGEGALERRGARTEAAGAVNAAPRLPPSSWAMQIAVMAAPADIAHTIQLAVAPVFLLAGIGQFLNVLASRLVRVVDRARSLEEMIGALAGAERARVVEEFRLLDARMRVANASVIACTASAVLVCLTVAGLFIAQLAGLSFARVTATLFILAMALLIIGLLLFLIEVRIAIRVTSIRVEFLEHED